MSCYPREIEEKDRVCWNCDNFIRDYDYYGECILRKTRKKVSNDKEACKKYVEREKEHEY
ncbi:MAG: hypothetical protein MJ197_10500 [Bacteroidales bacterium]|nr:hypothetical protein [Bacteroidales bacterium]